MSATRITRIRRSVANPNRLLVEARSGSVWRMVGTVFKDGGEWWAQPGYFTFALPERLGPFRLRREATAAVVDSVTEAAGERRAA